MDWVLGWPWVVFTKTPYKRVVGTIAAAAIAVGGLGYGVSKIPTGGAPPSTADFFVSPTGSGTACTVGAPCLPPACYQTAALGDVCEMAAGSYGVQVFRTSTGKQQTTDQPDVVFQPAAGAVITWFRPVSAVATYGDAAKHITFRDFSTDITEWIGAVGAGITATSPQFITFENVQFTDYFLFQRADSMTISGGASGPSVTGSGATNSCGSLNCFDQILNSTNITVTGHTIHEHTADPCNVAEACNFGYSGARPEDVHMEALRVENVTGLDITRSRWYANEQHNIFFTGTIDDVLLENNMFGLDINDAGGNVTAQCITTTFVTTNVLIRFNTFGNQPRIGGTGTPCSIKLLGNSIDVAAAFWQCQGGTTFAYNAYFNRDSEINCGTGDISTTAALAVVSNATTSASDLHLSSGSSIADNIVTPTTSDYTVTVDYDGGARTAGTRDAGSDEYGSP